MDKDKLIELRKKQADNKAKMHKELLDSNATIKDSILALNELVNAQEAVNLDVLSKQLQELIDSQTYGEDIKALKDALSKMSIETELNSIIEAVGNINNKDVVSAINQFAVKLSEHTIDQSPEAYQPIRRVRKIGQRLVFDDDPLQVNVSGGGGGSSMPIAVIRNSNSLAVVNPDGTNITDKFHFNQLGQLEVDTTFTGFATSDNQTNGSQIIGNARTKFRDGFSNTDLVVPNPDTWDVTNTNNDHIINAGGNSFGSSYLRISLSPFVESSEVTLTSKQMFKFPSKFGFGVSMSQRILGQELFIGIIGADDDGTVAKLTPRADVPITGATISITSNIGTVTCANHGFVGGDRISIAECAEHRLNVGPVVVTVIDKNTFIVPITLANGSYSTVGGSIRDADPFRYAKNGVGLIFETTSSTAGAFVSRRNGEKYRSLSSTLSTTVALQSNTSPYTDAFNSAAVHELSCSIEDMSYRSFLADSVAGPTIGKYSQGIPDEETNYKIHIRARTQSGFTKPIGRITSISKTGTTTATVTTDTPHGLVAGDWAQVYGARDQTNFPNQVASTVVGTVPTSTTFTTIIGTATTTSSLDGMVYKNEGSTLAPGIFAQVIVNMSATNGVLTLVGNGTWATPLPGEYVSVYGLNPSAVAYEGAYKVLRVNTTSLELEYSGTDFTSVTTGGSVIKRTDCRIHLIRNLDYTRNFVEVVGGRGSTTDINNSVPVSITGAATLPASQSSGLNSSIWNAAGWGGFLVADIASAAITSTTTTAAITPGAVANIGTYAHSWSIAVTSLSGTNPTLDVGIEESSDNGVNALSWNRIYDFRRITAVGIYETPVIRAQWGTRYRYVQTVTGTSPSFTRSMNRIQFSSNNPLIRQFVDRSIVLTTLNSTTPIYNVDGIDRVQLTINIGTATTPPAIQLEGSEDSTTFYLIGTPITATASSTVVANTAGIMPKFIRARVSTVGVAVVAGYVGIKAMGV